MNPNPIGLAAVAASLPAFIASYAKLRNAPPRTRRAALAILLSLALPALHFALYYTHWLPEWTWFYELRSWRGSEWCALFLGAALGALAATMSRWLLGFFLFAALALGLAPYLKPLVNPLDESRLRDRWSGDACLQSTLSTCGPASVCTIARSLGGRLTEREVAHSAHTCASGTEAWYLARLLRGRGYTVRFDFSANGRMKATSAAGKGNSAPLPAMVGVRMGSAGHFIAVLECHDGQVRFADPMSGEEQLPLRAFLRRYSLTGFRMVVSKEPHLAPPEPHPQKPAASAMQK